MQRATANFHASGNHFLNGDPMTALALVEEATRLEPFSAEYRALMAALMAEAGFPGEYDIDRANEIARHAFRMGHRHQETLRVLIAYYFVSEQHKMAFDMASKQSVLNMPYRPEVWDTRGALVEHVIANLDDGGDTLFGQAQRRLWLEKGLAIRDEMLEAEEGNYAEVIGGDDLYLLFMIWEDELNAP